MEDLEERLIEESKQLIEDYNLKIQFLKAQLDEDEFLNLIYKLDNKYGLINLNLDDDIIDIDDITILNSEHENMEEIIRISNEIKSISWKDYIIKILRGSNSMLNVEVQKVLNTIKKINK